VVPKLTDEFNDNTVDPNKWTKWAANTNWTGRKPSEFKPAQSTEGGGFLRLKSKRVAPYDNGSRWIHAAYVESNDPLFTTGMYSECRLKASREGMVTGFWMFHAPGNYGNEIDVTEAVGYAPDPSDSYLETLMRINSHNFIKGPPPNYEWLNDCDTKHTRPTGKVGENFYTYGVWRKNKRDMSFYFNGEWVVNKSSCRDMNANLHVIMDSELQNWIGTPPDWALNDNNRNTTYVDFVRTWKLVPDNGGTNDEIAFSIGITQLEQLTSYSFDVTYTAATQREIVVEFWSATNWLQQGQITVPAGSGTATVTVNLNQPPPVGQGYLLKTHIRPVGTTWMEALDQDQINDITIDGTLSTDNIDSNAFNIYPNPSKGIFTIDSNLKEKVNIQVYDLTCKRVYQNVLNTNTINLSSLTSGMYMMKMTVNNKTITKKVVVNK